MNPDAAPALRVLAGGPTAEEVAAIVVALGCPGPPAIPGGPRIPASSAWAVAARLEALGSAPVRSPPELRGQVAARA